MAFSNKVTPRTFPRAVTTPRPGLETVQKRHDYMVKRVARALRKPENHHHVVGIMANSSFESGKTFDPSVLQSFNKKRNPKTGKLEQPAPHIGGIGLFQWTNVRRRRIEEAVGFTLGENKLTSGMGKTLSDMDFQIDFFLDEFFVRNNQRGWSKARLQQYLRTTTDIEATAFFLEHFERAKVKDAKHAAVRLRSYQRGVKGTANAPRLVPVSAFSKNDIAKAQNFLNLIAGSNLAVDGLWGPNTSRVAKKLGFRKKSDILASLDRVSTGLSAVG